MSEPDFLYKPGENTAFRASLVEHWPSHYKKEMTGKLYMQAEPVMVNGLTEAETNALAEAHARGLISGLEIGIEQGAPSGQAWGWAIVDKNGDEVDTRARFTAFFGAVNHEEEPFDAEWLASRDREFPGLAPHRVVTLYTSPQPVAPAWQAETPKCRFSTGAVNPWSGEKTAGELAGQAAAGVRGEAALYLSEKQVRAVVEGRATWNKPYIPYSLVREGNFTLPVYLGSPAPAVARGVEDEQKEFKAAMKKLHHFALPGGSLWDTANVIEKSLMFKAWRAGRSTAGKEQA